MITIPSQFYQLINNKRLGWFFIFFATAAKALLTGVFTSYETDKSFYLLLANNLSEGKGFTIPISFLSNPGITENIYIPSANSPLYSILVAPLLKLFPGNYYLVTWIIESCSWLLLFIVLYKILIRLMPDYFWANLFILFSGCFIYNIDLSSSPKDVLSTALLFASLFMCLRIGEQKKNSWLLLVIAAFLFFLPGFTKSIYRPLTLVFPLSILFIGLLTKDRSKIRSGLITVLFSSILFAAHYFYFHGLETRAVVQFREFFMEKWVMAKSGAEFIPGFYFENLLRLYPFIPAAVFNLDSSGAQIRDHIPALYKIYGFMLYLTNAVGIAGLMAVFVSACKKIYRKHAPLAISFLITGLSISFAVILITCYLSVRYRAIEYKGSTGSWTFVYENRPYFFTIIFLQLCIFLFLFSRSHLSKIWNWIKWLVLFIMALGALHGFYFVIKNAIKPAPRKITINQLISSKTDSIIKANPATNVWLATEMQHLEWYAKLQNIHVLNRLPLLNDSSYKTPPQTILLTALAKEDTIHIRNYLNRKNVSLLENYNDAFFLFIESPKPDGSFNKNKGGPIPGRIFFSKF